MRGSAELAYFENRPRTSRYALFLSRLVIIKMLMFALRLSACLKSIETRHLWINNSTTATYNDNDLHTKMPGLHLQSFVHKLYKIGLIII